jgi:hypothetical protein
MNYGLCRSTRRCCLSGKLNPGLAMVAEGPLLNSGPFFHAPAIGFCPDFTDIFIMAGNVPGGVSC